MPAGALSSSDIEQFERDGYVVVRQAFARADASEIERRWWSELQAAHQISQDDRASWRPITGDLKLAKQDPIQARMLTGRVRGVLDQLLGDGAWADPGDWGRCLATFPEPGPWDVPTGLWHWDSPCELHLDGPSALFVVSFIGEVAPRSGGTLLLSGSPRLLMQLQRRMAGARRALPALYWDDLHRADPWLKALTGKAPSPTDRIAAFMETEAVVDGVPLRVVELTGEPGDMVVCHPTMVHCAAPNRSARPRFMRIKQQLLTHRGRRLLGELKAGRGAAMSLEREPRDDGGLCPLLLASNGGATQAPRTSGTEIWRSSSSEWRSPWTATSTIRNCRPRIRRCSVTSASGWAA